MVHLVEGAREIIDRASRNNQNTPVNIFVNRYPQDLGSELRLADRLGVRPLRVGDIGFDEVINSGTVKWAVTTDGQLLIIPADYRTQEIAHSVLTRGQPVLAAGEAEIAGGNGIYFMTQINNRSGHFLPSPESLVIGKKAFQNQGIDTTRAIEEIINP